MFNSWDVLVRNWENNRRMPVVFMFSVSDVHLYCGLHCAEFTEFTKMTDMLACPLYVFLIFSFFSLRFWFVFRLLNVNTQLERLLCRYCLAVIIFVVLTARCKEINTNFVLHIVMLHAEYFRALTAFDDCWVWNAVFKC